MPVLSHPNQYYTTNYHRCTSLVDEYKANMMLYLTKMFPEKDQTTLRQQLDKAVAQNYKPLTLQYLNMPSPGNIETKSDLLLEVTNKITHGVISPYGAIYIPASERLSMFTSYIKDNQAERKKVKHEELLAEAAGDTATKQFKFLRQLNIKININVLSGVMLSSVAFRSSINYNSITSTARLGIMMSYAIAEMTLEGNYYYANEGKAINWIVNLLRVFPGENKVNECITKYNLHTPDALVVYDAYVAQLRQYTKHAEYPLLRQLIDNLTKPERIYIYYAMNLARIIRENDSFREYFTKLLDVESVPNLEGEVLPITKVDDETLKTMAVVYASDEIPDKCTPDDIAASHPELNRRVYSIYKHIESMFSDIELLFQTFVMLPILPADIGLHKNMIRKTVLLSDTDSILFTDIHWVKWFTGDIKITTQATRMNAVMCTLLSKILEHSLGYMSASMGIETSNMKVIALKNEFMYDIFMRTPISKHYAGYIRYREGMRLTPCKLDLKGKNFRGSDLPATTTKFVQRFIKDTFDDFLVTYKLHPEVFIKKVISFEQRIKRSILAGEVTFLGQKPINTKESYKTPMVSSYVYYLLWTDVFAEKYGDLNLPQKCKEVFIQEVSIKNTKALDHMKTVDPVIYKKFIEFLRKWPKKTFSRVMIPIDFVIPEELISISNYKKVIKTNCYSLELVLKSFNIVNFPTKHGVNLFSDTYSELLKEVQLEETQNDRTIESEEDLNEDWLLEDDDDWFFDEDDDEDSESDSEWES